MAGPVTATARGDPELARPDGSVLHFPAAWRETNYGRVLVLERAGVAA